MATSKKDTPVDALAEIKLLVSPQLYRALQRCIWIRVNETGKTQLEVMEEIVLDFLKKHHC